MEPYALKHAIAEVEAEIENANMVLNHNSDQIINWAFTILLIAEMKQLNKNIDRICSQINRIR
jgi:hypothetical protein